MIKDLKTLLMQARALFQDGVASLTISGAAIDTAGSVAAMFTLDVINYISGDYLFIIEESSDNVDWSEIAADKYIGINGVDNLINSEILAGDAIKSIGCFSVDRYVRVTCIASGTPSPATVVSHAILQPELQPSEYKPV